ncbi:MAG: hypothetical protein ACOCQD_03685 [archaeon]
MEIILVNEEELVGQLNTIGKWKFEFYEVKKTLGRKGENFSLVIHNIPLKNAKVKAYKQARDKDIKKAKVKISKIS